MRILRSSDLIIYFGTAADQFFPDVYKSNPSDECFARVVATTGTRPLFAHQVHGTTGICITPGLYRKLKPFQREGDFLITQLPEVGVGVVTADCLPVIVYDPIHHAVGIAHAGWRGAVAGVVPAMIRAMGMEFKTAVPDVQVWFGPSIKRCCFEVQQDLMSQLPPEWKKLVLSTQEQRFFFDLPQLVLLQLQKLGVFPDLIDRTYNDCTCCDSRYFSYRRDRTAGRNMTAVSLVPR